MAGEPVARTDALVGDERGPRSTGQRGSRILGGADARYAAIATLSTVVVLGVLAAAVVTSPGWPTVKEKFFNGAEFRFWFPDVAHAFVTTSSSS